MRSRKQNILIELPPFQYISYFSTHLISQVHSKPKNKYMVRSQNTKTLEVYVNISNAYRRVYTLIV